MSTLSVQRLEKWYGERRLFGGVSFRIARGERVAIVGPNGVGKTTLLRVVAGLEPADSGAVALTRAVRVGMLTQDLEEESTTVGEHVRRAADHIKQLEVELHRLEAAMTSGHADLLDDYADLQHRFEHAGGYEFEATVKRALEGLGLAPLEHRHLRKLSGGERSRVALARLLLDDPDLMLLDEPTNHLDIAALEWFERFVLTRDSTFLVVSHDRYFLDRVTSRTLSFERGTVLEYRGSYSHYARQRADRDASLTKAADRQAIEIARTEEFIRRYGAGQRSKEARGRAKKLARVERIEAPERLASQTWGLDAAHMASDTVVETTALAIGHRRDAPIARTPPLRIGRGARVAVVGPNGAGKTTLLRTLIGELPAIDGYVASAPTARVAYLAQTQADLAAGTVLDALREASGLAEQPARDLLARFLFRGEDAFKDVSVLSGGERTRLALARLAARQANLLVLDEPTNHLDVAAREALESVLIDYDGATLFVSHDRYLIDKLANEVWLVEGGTLLRHEGNWTTLQRARLLGSAAFSPSSPADRAAARPSGAATSPERPLSSGHARHDPHGDDGSRRPRRASARPSRASARHSAGIQTLEQRIAQMEERIKDLQAQLAEVARSGNYMETRRVGEEHATLEQALRDLYDEWAKRGS